MNQDQPDKKPALKDWFDHEAVTRIAGLIGKVATDKQFSQAQFITTATAKLTQLEFQARVQYIADALKCHLPDHIPTALEILSASLPPALQDCENTTNDGWILWPLGHFIARHALDYPDAAFSAMRELTMRFTSEFAIRPFLIHYPSDMLARLHAHSTHPNPHIRRWCSEGCRPRLPWGGHIKSLIADPSPIFPILDQLIDAPELYVRKSVANNLNDIAKDHPDLVIQHCATWLKKSTSGRRWIVRHALRTLIKDGHPAALSLLGYSPPHKIEASISCHTASIHIGDSIRLIAQLSNLSDSEQLLMVDFVVHYPRKAGSTSAKVFKWKSLTLPANTSITLTKNVPFKLTTIRALYPGNHRIDLQINGHIPCQTSFSLETGSQ